MSGFELFLGALLGGLATLLFLTSLIAWKRTGSIKIGLISMALLALAVKGAYLTYTGMFYGWMAESTYMLIMDIAVIVLIYLSVLKG